VKTENKTEVRNPYVEVMRTYFKSKTIPDKKKTKNKNKCRVKVKDW